MFNYAPNTAKLRIKKIALVEATNEFEDEGAAPQGGCWGQFSKNKKFCHNFGIFAYFKLCRKELYNIVLSIKEERK